MMNRKFEIIHGENKCWRLTVTPNRVTIKVREGSNLQTETIDILYEFSKALGEVQQTWRASYTEGDTNIKFYNDTKTIEKILGDYDGV